MITNRPLRRLAALLALCAGFAGVAGSAQGAATIVIINSNAAGIGFNDPTPATPVGGNTGTTLGAQRLIAFQHAAGVWGATVTSSVPIRIAASFEPLPCSVSSAVLGAAGTTEIFTDFPKAPRAAVWYPGALASKIAGTDVASPGQPHIRARFNSRLGLSPDCFPGAPFYLGLDNNHGDQIDLVAVLLHEIAHGLGFQSFTDEETGEQFDDLPSVWDFFLINNRNEKLWASMNNEERRLSAISGDGLSWNGPRVTAATARALAPRSNLAIAGPASGAAGGNYEVGDATFGPPLSGEEVAGELMPVVDQPAGTGLACTPLDAQNALAVKGNIALVDRGSCAFVIKANIVQNAGAIGMVVVENVPGPVTDLGGTDPNITIPSVRITQAAGQALKKVLARRSRTTSGVVATLGVDPQRLAGADAMQRIRMHAPTEFAPGSSVSHFTVDAKPSQLMEPSINDDLTHAVKPPRDLAFPLLQDIGW